MYITLRQMYIYDISLSCYYNEKSFTQKLQRKSKHAFYIQKRFSENRAVYEVM
jgi:hypothetical protein